jgi:hypothetical protein
MIEPRLTRDPVSIVTAIAIPATNHVVTAIIVVSVL